MNEGGRQESKPVRFPHTSVLGVVLTYAGFGALWILLSDQTVAWLFREPEAITRASMIKGWLFIAVTALLLYGLVGRLVARQQKAHRQALSIEQERQQADDLLRAVVEASDDAIFAKDGAGRYLLFNTAASRFVGKPASEVIGRDDRALFPLEQAEMLMAIGRRVMATGRTETNEEIIDTSSGQRIFLGTKGPLRDAQGNIFGIFGVSRDITGRKRAEAALQESEARSTLAQESAHVGLWEYDLQTSRLYWSPELRRLYGVAADLEPSQAFWQSRVHPDDWPDIDAAWRAQIDRHESFAVEFRFRRADNDAWRWLVSMGKAHYDAAGRTQRLAGINLDITARKAAEAELKARNDELERFSRASIGREMKVIELKLQVNALAQELGRAPPYPQTAALPPDAPEAPPGGAAH